MYRPRDGNRSVCALFVPLEETLMASGQKVLPTPEEWSVEAAEALLLTLTEVVSVRIVTAKKGGEIKEIHLLTTDAVAPKQTVRNVESALRAHFDMDVDHRKISVAQQGPTKLRLPSEQPGEVQRIVTDLDPSAPSEAPETGSEAVDQGGAEAMPAGTAQVAAEAVAPPAASGGTAGASPGGPAPSLDERSFHLPRLVSPLPTAGQQEKRILFSGHRVEAERAQRVRMKVAVEWNGMRYSGDAEGPDLPRPRLEAVARASLRAVEAAVVPELSGRTGAGFELSLDGVKQFEAFDKDFVMVAVHALSGRSVTTLSGTAAVQESQDRAVIMATLQATDRWVRGRI